MSDEYRALPVTLAGASTRVVAWLMYLVCSGQLGMNDLRFARDFRAGRLQRGLDDVRMRAATAQIPGAGMFDLIGGRAGIVFQQCRHAHDETRRAITTLQHVPV